MHIYVDILFARHWSLDVIPFSGRFFDARFNIDRLSAVPENPVRYVAGLVPLTECIQTTLESIGKPWCIAEICRNVIGKHDFTSSLLYSNAIACNSKFDCVTMKSVRYVALLMSNCLKVCCSVEQIYIPVC